MTLLALLWSLVMASQSSANIGEAFGLGSRSASLSGAGFTSQFNSFSAYSNPATLSSGEKTFSFEYGFIFMSPSFTPITGIITQNTFTLDSNTTGDIDLGPNEYRPTMGQILGVNFSILKTNPRISIGAATFLPFNQTMYLDTGFLYLPEYVMYRSRTQRPQLDMGVGVELGNGFHIGAGFHLGFILTSNADITLQNDSSKTSAMRFLSSLKPAVSPHLGLMYGSGYWKAGIVARFPQASTADMTVRSRARMTTLPAAFLDFNFNALSALQYDPGTLELGGSYEIPHLLTLFMQFDFQNWNAFQIPAMNVKNSDNSGVVITNSVMPTYSFNNIWIPRVGIEAALGSSKIRFGYAYHPSILNGGTPSGLGNTIDPPSHRLSAGYGLELKDFLGIGVSTLDIHLSYHQLVSGHVTKTSATEIGSPGYDTGGRILGGGLSLSLML
jgi:hypothetical protein